MTLIQLRCFVALAEELNFTRVAERLYVSQATISYQIKTLEEELGVSLFDRTTKSVSVTSTGKMIYRDIKLALDLIDRAEGLLRLENKKPTFTIGYSYFCNGPCLNELIQKMSIRHPDVRFMLEHVEPEDNMRSRLLSQSVDVCLFIDPFNKAFDDLTYCDLGDTNSAVMCSVSSPLARKDTKITPAMVAKETIVTFAQVENRHHAIEAHQCDTQQIVIARDVGDAFEMIRTNLAIALFPTCAFTGHEGIALKESYAPADRDVMTSRTTLAWKKGVQSKLITELCSEARAIVERETPDLLLS